MVKATTPILATGSSLTQPCPPLANRGFTLVEVLVVVAMISIMLAAVRLTLPDTRLQAQQLCLTQLQQQADKAMNSSLYRGRPYAWEVGETALRILQRDNQDGTTWVSAGTAGDQESVVTLKEDLVIKQLSINGKVEPLGTLVVFSGGLSPPFEILLAADGRQWQLSGDPAGRIRLEVRRGERWEPVE